MTAAVERIMAFDAECHQVFGAVVPKAASRLYVMNLQIAKRAAILAAPSIPLENLPTKVLVCLCFEAYSWLFES